MITLTHDLASPPRAMSDGVVAEQDGVLAEQDGVLAEQFGALVHWIRSSGNPTGSAAKRVGVTSCGAGEGVSTVATNLAVAAAHSCARPALLLDLSGKPPSPQLASRRELGLHKEVAPDSRPSERAVASLTANLSFLSMQETRVSRGLWTGGAKVDELLRELERDFDFIVVDLPRADSSLCFAVAEMLDGLLLVVEAQRTDGEAAARATQRLGHANATVLGVILNKYS
jgi:Mrp family chromosome partitioning ATPase